VLGGYGLNLFWVVFVTQILFWTTKHLVCHNQADDQHTQHLVGVTSGFLFSNLHFLALFSYFNQALLLPQYVTYPHIYIHIRYKNLFANERRAKLSYDSWK